MRKATDTHLDQGSIRPLSSAAKRALLEAAERRKSETEATPEAELGGRDGPEPTRFGDWEKMGIVSDF